jgi:hypothetical protein
MTISIKDLHIPRHPNHDHYWIQNGVLGESYQTIRGLRFRELAEVSEFKNNKNLSKDEMISVMLFLENKKELKNEKHNI